MRPPVVGRLRSLPLRDPAFTWEDFEDLCRAVAREVDGYRHVHRYGRRGQNQRAIDLLAASAVRGRCVYQVRDIGTLTAGELRRAVEEFVALGSRFGAIRFVLCVACEARDTRVIDELESLRRKYSDVDLEICDADELSRLLRTRWEIVEEFFGDDIAQAFCVGRARVERLDADELLRGPVRALGLEDAVTSAGELEASEPRRAANVFDEIAAALAERFPRQARTFRGRSARALETAGAPVEAFDRWFGLGLEELRDRSEPRVSPDVASAFRRLSPEVDETRQMKFQVLEAWEQWHEDVRQRALLADAFDALAAAHDPFAEFAGVLFAEACLVDRDPELVRERERTIRALAGSLDTPDQVRLAAALADSQGRVAWDELYARATNRELEITAATYVAMRAGRAYAWLGEVALSETAYRRAIELGATAALSLDVENALWSLTALYANFRRLHDRLFPANEMALAVNRVESYVRQSRRTRERALREIANGEPHPEAHMWLRHELWEAFVAADLLVELEALRDLGRLYARAGFGADAVRLLVRAGDHKDACELLKQSPIWVDLSVQIRSTAQWEREAAMRAVAVEGDLVPATNAHELVPLIVEALSRADGELAAPAAELAAAIVRQLPLEDVERLARTFRPLAAREPGHYRLTDSGLFRFAGRAYEMFPQLRAQLAQILGTCAVGDALDNDLIRAVAACEIDPAPIRDALEHSAAAGHAAAGALLGFLNADSPIVHERARRRVAQILELTPGQPRSEFKIGMDFTVPPVALAAIEPRLRSRYAGKLADIGSDETDVVPNRESALTALAVASSSLDDTDRATLFPRVLAIARDARLSSMEAQQQLSNHPLSRFRLNFGRVQDVQVAALEAAAQLMTTVDDQDAVTAVAADFMRATGDPRIAGVFYTLVERGAVADPHDFAMSRVAALRQLSAAIWCTNPSDIELGRRLSADPEVSVRLELARGLPRLGKINPRIAAELQEQLSRDASANVRWVSQALADDIEEAAKMP